MATLLERIREAVPGAVFFAGATEEGIAAAEGALGVRLPAWLREVYLCTNGIQEGTFRDSYLYALEPNGEFPHGLVSWNLFLRESWAQVKGEYAANLPETDWEGLDPRHLLVVGGRNGVDWAVDLRRESMEIVEYDVRDPERREVVGADLAEAYLKDRLFAEKIHRQIYRGREAVRREAALPAQKDVEYLLDTLVEMYRGSLKSAASSREATSPGWSLYQGTTAQRERGEEGQLFVFVRGAVEVQVATRDGNLPFVMRAKAGDGRGAWTCLVKGLPEAMMCLLSVMDAVYWGEERERVAAGIWRHRYGPGDAWLERAAEVLFARDDARLE